MQIQMNLMNGTLNPVSNENTKVAMQDQTKDPFRKNILSPIAAIRHVWRRARTWQAYDSPLTSSQLPNISSFLYLIPFLYMSSISVTLSRLLFCAFVHSDPL